MTPARPAWVTCAACGDAIADTAPAEWDALEQVYYCGCPGSARGDSTPAAHCDWGNHETTASLVHVMANDDTACEACIKRRGNVPATVDDEEAA